MCKCGSSCKRVIITERGETGPQGATGSQGPQGLPGECICETVLYEEQRLGVESLGNGEFSLISDLSYTVPADGDGTYEFYLLSDVVFEDGGEALITLYLNGSEYNGVLQKSVKIPLIGETMDVTLSISFFASNVALVEGDVVEFRGRSSNYTDIYLNRLVCKIKKIS
jgi:hypothetical protein